MPATYEPIATTTLGSAAASITFSSIAASWTDLRVIVIARDTQANTGHSIVSLRFNGDTGTNYSWTELQGNGSSANSNRATNVNVLRVGWHPNANTTSGVFSLTQADIFNYAGSTNKTALGASADDTNGGGYVVRNVGMWRNTAAITSVTVFDSFGDTFAIGTTATLYGILKA